MTGPVSRRSAVVVRDAKLALEVRPKHLKAVLPGPVTLAQVARVDDGTDRAALATGRKISRQLVIETLQGGAAPD